MITNVKYFIHCAVCLPAKLICLKTKQTTRNLGNVLKGLPYLYLKNDFEISKLPYFETQNSFK